MPLTTPPILETRVQDNVDKDVEALKITNPITSTCTLGMFSNDI